MDFLPGYIKATGPFLWFWYKRNPAEWTTVVLLLLTLLWAMIVRWWERKKMMLKIGVRYDDWYPDHWFVIATNISKDWRIRPVRYGVRTWRGEYKEGRDFIRYISDISGDFLSSGERVQFAYYDGDNKTLPDRVGLDEVYYAYVVDSSGDIHLKYLCPLVIRWPKRLYNCLRNFF